MQAEGFLRYELASARRLVHARVDDNAEAAEAGQIHVAKDDAGRCRLVVVGASDDLVDARDVIDFVCSSQPRTGEGWGVAREHVHDRPCGAEGPARGAARGLVRARASGDGREEDGLRGGRSGAERRGVVVQEGEHEREEVGAHAGRAGGPRARRQACYTCVSCRGDAPQSDGQLSVCVRGHKRQPLEGEEACEGARRLPLPTLSVTPAFRT
jgi:hypothetical protein